MRERLCLGLRLKNNPDEFSKYEKMAEDKNKERGFTNEDPKSLKNKNLMNEKKCPQSCNCCSTKTFKI